MKRPPLLIVTFAALLAAACSRSPAPSIDAGEVTPPPSSRAEAEAVTSPPAPDDAPPATLLEARRAHLTTLADEPGLARNAKAIAAHFDGGVPPAMDLQAVALGSGKQGLLVRASDGDPRPIALLVEATGAPLWTRERPFAGISPPVGPFTIAPRPDNGLALFLYDEPTKLVAARMWTRDGAPFSDTQLYALARCEAIAAAWWPGRGWIVVTAFPGGARGQLLREEGTAAWDARGVVVGEPWRATAPASLVIDPPTASWVLLQHATRGGADHVVAIRYSADGARLGERDLGGVPRLARPTDRIDAVVVGPGVLRVDVGGKGVETRVEEIL